MTPLRYLLACALALPGVQAGAQTPPPRRRRLPMTGCTRRSFTGTTMRWPR